MMKFIFIMAIAVMAESITQTAYGSDSAEDRNSSRRKAKLRAKKKARFISNEEASNDGRPYSSTRSKGFGSAEGEKYNFELSLSSGYSTFGKLAKYSEDGSDPTFEGAPIIGLNLGVNLRKGSPWSFQFGYFISNSNGTFGANAIQGQDGNGNNVIVSNGGAVEMKYSILTAGVSYQVSGFFLGLDLGVPNNEISYGLTNGQTTQTVNGEMSGLAYGLRTGYQLTFLSRYFINLKYQYQKIIFDEFNINGENYQVEQEASFSNSLVSLDLGIKF